MSRPDAPETAAPPKEPKYVPGEWAIPLSDPTRLERKSPPLASVQPLRDRNLRVDPRRYTGVEEAEREWKGLWSKVWLCAGRVSDLPKIGSWFQFEFGDDSIIIVRSGPDRISALYNACQHRGNQLVTGEFGDAAQFVCGYHSWRYDLTGRCRHVTDRKYFKPEALSGRLDLGSLRCETWGGCVFVNMDPDAISLREYLGEIVDLLDPYQLQDMSIIQDCVVDLDCNWKTVLDAFSESYHVHILHPTLMLAIEDQKLQYDFYAHGHSRHWVPIGTPSARLAAADLTDVQRYMLAEACLDPADFAGRPNEVRAAIQQVKRRPDNPWGLDYSRLTDAQLTDSWTMNIFPNLQLIAQPEGFLMQRYIPDPKDPNKCRQHIMALAPKMKPGVRPPAYLGVKEEADLGVRPARQRSSWEDPDLLDKIGLILWQDVSTTRQCQRGMRSRGFDSVRFSEQEQRNLHQFAEIDRYLYPGKQ
jgi:phenylpropionate dioxygenase-like ring-hydroxylating dioxygenase large terminal subunit